MCTSVHLCVGVCVCVCVCVCVYQIDADEVHRVCALVRRMSTFDLSLTRTRAHTCAPHLDQSEGKATAQQKTHLLANLYYASCAYERVVNRL